MSPADVALVIFPFGGKTGRKLRPALLLTGRVGPIPEVIYAYISTAIPPTPFASDLVLDPGLPEFASTNLKTVSVLRLHKLASVHQHDVVRQLGVLDLFAMDEVRQRLRTLLQL